jgi:capsular exopolysaccharide synthesis family protein
LKSLLITSVHARQGSADIMANVGTHLASKANCRVLLIDADLRRPPLQRILRLPRRPGLADVLQGQAAPHDAMLNGMGSLTVLSAGRTAPSPMALLDSSRMRDLLDAARQQHDLVLVHCANLKEFNDGAALASYVDGIVLVVDEGQVRRQVIQAALAPLEQIKANLVGVVLNRRSFAIPRLIYDWV